jgi:hypothetical protein
MTAPEGHPGFISSIDVTAGFPTSSARPAAGSESKDELTHALRDMTSLLREHLQISREQLELLRRAEDRFQRQQDAQREEFQRWFAENPGLAGYCGGAHDQLRTLLGRAIAELVQFVDDHGDNLVESDFVRMEMVDKYGSLLNHASAMYSMLKRLAAAEQAGADSSSGLQC